MDQDQHDAPSYATALVAMTMGLFLCSGVMVGAYVEWGVWAAVALAVLGGFVMHGVSTWATPALLEDDDLRL